MKITQIATRTTAILALTAALAACSPPHEKESSQGNHPVTEGPATPIIATTKEASSAVATSTSKIAATETTAAVPVQNDVSSAVEPTTAAVNQ